MTDQTMYQTPDLYVSVFFNPYSEGYREIHILSGYASPSFLLRVLNDYPELSIHLYIGMIPSGSLSQKDHSSFKQIMNDNPHVQINYVASNIPIHSKVYHWVSANDKPTKTFIGSSNFSNRGFFDQIEIMIQDNSNSYEGLFTELTTIMCVEDGADNLVNIDAQNYLDTPGSTYEHFDLYVKKVESDSLEYSSHGYPYVTSKHSDVLDENRICHSKDGILHNPVKGGGFSIINMDHIHDQVTLSLLSSGDKKKPSYGLNWGHREKRNRNESYISVPSHIHRNHPDFFPDRKIPFELITEEGIKIFCVMAQDNSKAIESHENNSLLGKHLRQKLDLNDGAYITLKDLERYGKTEVIIEKLSDLRYKLIF